MRLRILGQRHAVWLPQLLRVCFPGEPDEHNAWSSICGWYNSRDSDNMVAVLEHRCAYYAAVFYTLRATDCVLQTVIVPVELRRRGYGTRAVRRLIRGTRTGCLLSQAEESNVGGQLFLKSLGFFCQDPRQHKYVHPAIGKTYYRFVLEQRSVQPSEKKT